MADEYTPLDHEIRQAKAEALREVADDVTSWLPLQDRARLRNRADQIAAGDQT